jgi:hypothetical protein
MFKNILIVLTAFFVIVLSSCGKKNIPSKTASVTPAKSSKAEPPAPKKEKPAPLPPATDTATVAVAEEKPAPKPAEKPDFPKVISVNDEAASKSVDGRLFYDVLGHRYWKNYTDGKYYLFNKSMYSNPDFKPHK